MCFTIAKKAAAQEEEDDNPCARCYSNVQPDTVSTAVVYLKRQKMPTSLRLLRPKMNTVTLKRK